MYTYSCYSGPDTQNRPDMPGYGRNWRPRIPQEQPNGPRKSLVFDAAVGNQPGHPYGVQVNTVNTRIVYTKHLPKIRRAILRKTQRGDNTEDP